IVTPGMIELANEQYSANFEFGRIIADVCDEVILIGKEQTKPIYDGLIDKKFDEEKIHVLNDVKLAFNLIKHIEEGETYVLLENDLPDIFNEK
ncbi:MAG TPA: UDP-N-acetylmuramoyl-tripeptide--D-alanyl-D-alanine ligase, partial [Tenericutes bacterium]|nr:UDP-N-acetylmuramoyl-tripeptide--D-alanyl-D-alanine ligase [Mycoplasmatota bacterium]